MIIRSFGFAIILAFLLSACKSNQVALEQVPARSLAEVLDSLDAKTLDYTFFYGKAKLKYNGQESSIGGAMTIMAVPDEKIWMRFKKISIEGARALIQPDSTWILYRREDLYTAEATQDFLDRYNLAMDFGDIQEILIGNYPLPEPSEVQVYQESEYYHIEWQGPLGKMRYHIDHNMNLAFIRIDDAEGRTFTMKISDYDEIGFGRRRDIRITDIDATHADIALKFSSITFDEPRDIMFDIPDHYSRYH